MREWAEGVEGALDALSEFAAGADADAALRLAEHALARIEDALGSADDSAGHGGWLLGRAQEIHLAACLAARPDPVALARYFFARETGGGYDTFANAAAIYAEALGRPGSPSTAAWPPRPGTRCRRAAAGTGRRAMSRGRGR